MGSCEFDGLRYICVDPTTPTTPTTPAPVTPTPTEPGEECVPGCSGDQECRNGRCLDPDPNGRTCEFDDECWGEGDHFFCIAGYCTPDPRMQPCERDAECPVGFTCDRGMCDPGGGCVDDGECGDNVCVLGECRDPMVCDVVHPVLDGEWTWNSTLDTREGLSGFADAGLSIASAATDFLDGGNIELPGLLRPFEGPINDELRRVVEEEAPHLLLEAIRGLAVLDRIMQTMTLEERVQLTSMELDRYSASRELLRMCLGEGADMRCATDPSDLESFGFDPQDFRANAVCGNLIILEHDIEFDFAGVLLWVANAIVETGSEGQYETIEELLDAMRGETCDPAAEALGRFAADLGMSSGNVTLVEGLARTSCNAAAVTLRDRVVDGLRNATVGLSLIEIKGYAPIGERTMDGVWEGSLMGGDFPGSFQAFR